MRASIPPALTAGRLRVGEFRTDDNDGLSGAFFVVCHKTACELKIISSTGHGWEKEGLAPPCWEHVSVSTRNRCPNWDEMCFVKSLFWDDTETVVQFHPDRAHYVNCHPYTLHLWKPVGISLVLPDSLAV